MNRWEYKNEVEDFFEMQNEDKRLTYLNSQGRDGWELTNIEENDEVSTTFWFKRNAEDL